MTEDMNTPNPEHREAMPPPPLKRRRMWLFLLVVILGAAASGAYFYGKRMSPGAAAANNSAAPSKSDNSMPGMTTGAPGATVPSDAGAAVGQIYIAPERQQLIGVKTASAEMKSLVKEMRTVGRVAYDETKITHIHTKVSGYI